MFPFKMILRGTNEAVSYFLLPQRVGAVYDFLHSDDGLRAAEPTYSGRWGPGFKIFQKNLINEGSKLQFKVNLGLRYRQRYQLKFERVHLFGSVVNNEFLLSYTLQPDESFFGIGPNTSEDDRTNFLHERAYAQVGLGRMLSERVEMSTSFSFEQNNIRGGKHPDYESITEAYNLTKLPGLESKLRMLGIGLALRYDSRNSIGRPTSGTEIMLSGGVFDQIKKDHYRYWKVNADVRQYLHLFFRRAVMFRLAGEMTESLSDGAVPFYHLSELGRSETIRGFSRGRFRDRDMLLGSVEYYYPIWQGRDNGVDAFLFVDAGQVANNIMEDFNPDDLQVGFGGGLRFSGELSESVRVMVAKSKEGFRFYLDLNL
ncbi:MAG: BamA/TamA family outer membrane protein [candidate division Zixibacteria bacterium]|nr:BamA/TamA family outer membrane protein [candidate division Zixibacteria bacterium]